MAQDIIMQRIIARLRPMVRKALEKADVCGENDVVAGATGVLDAIDFISRNGTTAHLTDAEFIKILAGEVQGSQFGSPDTIVLTYREHLATYTQTIADIEAMVKSAMEKFVQDSQLDDVTVESYLSASHIDLFMRDMIAEFTQQKSLTAA